MERTVLYLKALYKPDTTTHVYNPNTQGEAEARGLSQVIDQSRLQNETWREAEYLYQMVVWLC